MDSDKEGLFIFLKGLIGDKKVTLANLYTPNARQDVFIVRQIKRLMQYTEGQLVVAGDLNVPLSPAEDTSSGTSAVTRDARKRIGTALHSAQLIAWRLFHPGERDYSSSFFFL